MMRDEVPAPKPLANTHGKDSRVSTTLWTSPNRFSRCLSAQLIGARSLPAASDLKLQLHAGKTVHEVPLLLSQADIEAGGSGRIDDGRLSERVDVLLEANVAAVTLHLHLHELVPWWRSPWSAHHLVAQCPLAGRWASPGVPGASLPEWFPLVNSEAAASGEPTECDEKKGPSLLLRIQCFDAENLESAESRGRLFLMYSSDGCALTRSECDRMLADVAAGWRPDGVPSDGEADSEEGVPRGVCRVCAAHMLAAFGCYRPEEPLLTYLMYYHTLTWVVCRAPGEEHIPVAHRLCVVLLSMAFNLMVVILFTATDCSLVNLKCPVRSSCSAIERSGWAAAQVGLVAVIDSAFWPLIKMLFFFFEKKLRRRDESEEEHTRTLWRRVLYMLLAPFPIAFAWVFLSAGNHQQQLATVLDEFMSTWPTARLTETFKLMSMWGLLIEYGMKAPASAAGAWRTDAAEEAREQDPKKVPLLKDRQDE